MGWSVTRQKAARHTLRVVPTPLQPLATASLANACDPTQWEDATPGGTHTGSFVATPRAEQARNAASQLVAHHLGGYGGHHR